MANSNQQLNKIEDHLKAKILSPGKLFVYWHLQEEKVRFIGRYFLLPDSQLTKALRLYDFDSGAVIHEAILRHGVSSWLLKGVNATSNYQIELGIKPKTDTFFPMLRSNVIIQNSFNQKAGNKPLLPGWCGKVSTYTYYENLEGSINK
ncbi:DUF4912 domain-containing protein [Bacillus sp. ISL-35]|uniref:DUF4912 domain-containing protein n=1 Tax=Bacillus sp. ISL-35 TaxID=2819122 RepID=UPI001BEC7131|nr:DUF4912 domain-containing protein [Bacillus sp. ISL-35]MBT2702115.1 DUF4912 domain-containing protein [Chryseobacterium sp. ISL-80]